VGFEVDALRSLAASMKAKLSIKTLSFTGLIPGLQAHQFDMVAQSLSYTPARAKVVSFTKPYIPYAVILAVPKGKAASVTSPAALNKPGDVITALQGSLSESIAQKLFPKATIQPLSDQNSTLLDVATGRASGVVVESTILAQFNKSNPGELAVAHIAKPFELEYGRYAVPHGDTKLVNYINSWICKSSKQNGTLAKAYTKEFGAKWPGLPAC
jgi:polar amino acid transport system substrate-binding protein